MNRYLIQTTRRTILHGVAIFEVIANSKEEAMQEYTIGKKHEVDEHIESIWHDDTSPEIINESKEPPNLLDYETKD